MITNNDYEKSVLITQFLKELKDRISEKENITDVLFTPVTGGYEVSFSYGDKSIFVTAEVKGFFTKKLIIRKLTDGKKTAVYKAHSKEEISRYAERILS
ncbi:MAG: hypothetical protein IKV21_01760 [Clostridia bacterium]|nr:hypothetical protein [Clostridia bacterium]